MTEERRVSPATGNVGESCNPMKQQGVFTAWGVIETQRKPGATQTGIACAIDIVRAMQWCAESRRKEMSVQVPHSESSLTTPKSSWFTGRSASVQHEDRAVSSFIWPDSLIHNTVKPQIGELKIMKSINPT